MAIRKKGKRKIKYENNEFYWSYRTHYPEDILILRVMSEEKSFSQLICEFNYKDFWLYFSTGTGDNWKLTPQIIKQCIEYGLAKGWKPHEKENHFVIKNMDKILGIKSRK